MDDPADVTAEDLAADAAEEPRPARRRALARRALRISPDCVSAHCVLAEAAATPAAALASWQAAVAAGARGLGERAFREDVGQFWVMLAARPYMHARAGLARCLAALGRHDEAIEHYRALLRLNPNDNQGLRDDLVALYALTRRDADLGALLDAYAKDCSAVWKYAAALHLFFTDHGGERSTTALRSAMRQNPHVPPYLLGDRPRPRTLPDCYSPGDEREAAGVAHAFAEPWRRTEGASAWLREVAPRRRRAAATSRHLAALPSFRADPSSPRQLRADGPLMFWRDAPDGGRDGMVCNVGTCRSASCTCRTASCDLLAVDERLLGVEAGQEHFETIWMPSRGGGAPEQTPARALAEVDIDSGTVSVAEGGTPDTRALVAWLRTEVDAEVLALLRQRWADGKRRRPGPARVDKVGPNAVCPCGSAKKFKRCCGAVAAGVRPA